MEDLQRLTKKFNESVFTLSKENIYEFNKMDNGPLNNVISRINKHCYGVMLHEKQENDFVVEMYFVENLHQLKGDIISLNLNDKDYFQLLLRFCTCLEVEYDEVDAVTAFNTFQTYLRGFLEKMGFLTTTSLELKPYGGKSGILVGFSQKGIKNVILIDRVDFYRDLLGNINKFKEVENSNYVYLMVNCNEALFKIGTSKAPKYRERTLQSQEPNISIIAVWRCDKSVEKELHLKYKEMRRRGEWFKLKLKDLVDIQNYMKIYNCS